MAEKKVNISLFSLVQPNVCASLHLKRARRGKYLEANPILFLFLFYIFDCSTTFNKKFIPRII